MQAQRGGEIELIGVKEGDQVEKDQVLFKLRSWETWGDLREWEQAEIAFQKAEYDLKTVLPQRARLNRETIDALEQRLAVLQRFMAAHQNALEDYRSDVDNVGGSQNRTSDAGLQAQIGFRQAEIDLMKQAFLQQKTLFERELISRADMNRRACTVFKCSGRASVAYVGDIQKRNGGAGSQASNHRSAYCTRARGIADATRL